MKVLLALSLWDACDVAAAQSSTTVLLAARLTPPLMTQVTKIEDAQKLWSEMQLKQRGGFKAETEEEFEDAAGNVYNKRTYLVGGERCVV